MSERPATYIVKNVYHVDFGHGAFILRPQSVIYNNRVLARAKVIPIAIKNDKGRTDD